MTLEPNDLLLFARVVEAGSFSRAAERLHFPKSTVSRRIAELERDLGERLLLRTTRKLAVTEFGLHVLEHARQVVVEVDGAMALALHRQAKPSGKLRVSMPADFANVTLSAMLASFAQEHPAIQLEVDVSPRRVDLIAENFDLAIRVGELPDDAQLVARRLASMSVGLYASPSYLRAHGELISPETLENMHALMILSRSGEPLAWKLSSAKRGDARQVTLMPSRRTLANSPELLTRMARKGTGVTAVTDHFAAPYVASGELVRVLPGWCLEPAVVSAVFPGRRLMPARTRVFLDALASLLTGCDKVGAFGPNPPANAELPAPMPAEQQTA